MGLDNLYSLRNAFLVSAQKAYAFPVVSSDDTLGDGGADVGHNHLEVVFCFNGPEGQCWSENRKW
jgi:hypothetical protein